METHIQRMLDMFNELRKNADVNACFGEPVSVEGRTVIPVARVGYGFGVTGVRGSTRDTEEVPDLDELYEMEAKGIGRGGGGGLSSAPLAVIEVTAEGTRVEPVIDEQKVAVVGLLVGAWSTFWLARALIAIFGPRE